MQINEAIWLSQEAFTTAFLTDYAAIISDKKQKENAALKTGTDWRNYKTSASDIEIVGMLLPSVPRIWGYDIREFGIQATGYDEIAEQAQEALDSESESVSVYVDSGGGSAAKLDIAFDALKLLAEKKQVNVMVDGMAASAAYWLASIGDNIEATRMSQIGSIGVYTLLFNDAADTNIVVRSGAQKGAGWDKYTDVQIAAFQERVDKLANDFMSDVVANRPQVSREKIKDANVWWADDALKIGLIDSITNESKNTSNGQNGFVGAAPDGQSHDDNSLTEAAEAAQKKEQTMSEELQKEMAELRSQVKGVVAEDKRKTAILSAFSDDPAFALQQVNAGASIEEAQAAYNAKLRKEAADLRAELNKAKASEGTEPIESHGGEGEQAKESPENWQAALKFIARRDNCSLSAAGRKACKEFPDLHPVNARRGN